MIEGGTDIQKAYVNQDGTAVLKCPACEAVKSAKVDTLKNGPHQVKVRCNCRNVFSVRLEFRKNYRKETKLAGDYKSLAGGKNYGKLTVVNLSKGGVGAQVVGFNPCRTGDELQVSFNLDDRHHSLIDKRVVVRLVKENYIGCEFLDPALLDKALGFYLMV